MSVCEIHSGHSPSPKVVHKHHVIPLSWGGEKTVVNIRVLCPTSHENVHTLLNHYVRGSAEPSWEIRRHYGSAERDLAAQAWASRPSDKPPYTEAVMG